MPLSVLDKIVAIRATSTQRHKKVRAASSIMASRMTPKRSTKDKYNQTARTNQKLMLETRRKSDRLSRIPATSGMLGKSIVEIRGVDIPKATYNFNTFNDDNSAGWTLMNAIQQGDAFYQRDGNKINMRNIHLRGYLHPRVTSPTGEDEYVSSPGKIRMIIVYDRQPTGAVPTNGDLLRSHDQSGSASTSDCSEINLNNRDRWAILRDKEWFIPSFTYKTSTREFTGAHALGYVGMEDPYCVNEFIKLKDLGVTYKGNATPMTVAHVSTGAVWMVLLKSGTNVHMAFEGGWRIRYSDL